jgi:hypothetical protein
VAPARERTGPVHEGPVVAWGCRGPRLVSVTVGERVGEQTTTRLLSGWGRRNQSRAHVLLTPSKSSPLLFSRLAREG